MQSAMRKGLFGVLGLAACLTVATIAYAAVIFDAGTGTGFVGKGDLQLPWGWNDAKLQANANTVSFDYVASASATYAADCEWFTGPVQNRRRHEVTHTVTTVTEINSTITYETRKNSQQKVTGFVLTGAGDTTETEEGDVPVVGSACLGDGTAGTWISVELVEGSETSSAGLYASSSADAGYGPTLIWSPIP
jgi:hypothetical protein